MFTLYFFPFCLNFNSIKVRLKHNEITEGETENVGDFNSIKVRLKPRDKPCIIFDSTFQFHKGTIKTDLVNDALFGSDISIP